MKKNDVDIGSVILGAVIGIIIVALIITYICFNAEAHEEIPTIDAKPIVMRQIEVIEKTGSVPDAQEIKEPVLSDEDIMAIVAECEAGNQKLIGKVAVIATILNRCDYYGETVETVVYKPNQYAFDKEVVPSEESYLAVKIALRERDLFPDTMMWFRRDYYHKNDKLQDYIPIGNHYFSVLKAE